jgi:WD40 repeat protein
VRLWDAQSGELLNLLKHPMNVMNIIFSPFGSRIATVGDDGIVRIWGIPGD